MSACVCAPGTDGPQYCPRHWPDYVDLRAADAAELARQGAQLALGTMRQLLTAAMPPVTRVWLDHLWESLAERAVTSVTISAPAVSIVDERSSTGLRDVQAKANG